MHALMMVDYEFFPVPCLFAAEPQKSIVRVNGRERGWKFDKAAKCPGAPIHARTHLLLFDLSYLLRKVITFARGPSTY